MVLNGVFCVKIENFDERAMKKQNWIQRTKKKRKKLSRDWTSANKNWFLLLLLLLFQLFSFLLSLFAYEHWHTESTFENFLSLLLRSLLFTWNLDTIPILSKKCVFCQWKKAFFYLKMGHRMRFHIRNIKKYWNC